LAKGLLVLERLPKYFILANDGPNCIVFTTRTPYNSDMLCNTATLKKGIFIMMRFNPETKTYKLFTALHNGEKISASQAHKRFGIKNISAEVSRVRQAGFAVYANSRKARNGVQVTEYRIGTPSRKLVAAGYRALAMGLV
jgi:hypothetical protein